MAWNTRIAFGAVVSLLLLGALSFSSPIAHATTPSVVQATAQGALVTSGKSISVTFSGSVTAGDTIVAECTSALSSSPIASIADSFGSLTNQMSSSFISGNSYVEIASHIAASSITDTVTCTWSGPASWSYMTLSIQEASGILATASSTVAGSGTGTSLHTSSSLSYAYDSFLVAAYVQSNGSTFTAGTGFTRTLASGADAGDAEYQLDPSAGSTDFPMTLASSENWGGIGAVFPKSTIVTTTASTYTTTTGGSTVTTATTLTSYATTGGPKNFWMKDAISGSTFAISSYANSYVKVSFPDKAPVFYYNITQPNLDVFTHGASLITVWVGTSYYVSIIPNDTTLGLTNTVYLSKPASVYYYTFSVQDLTGYYPSGTKIFLNDTTGSYKSRVLASGYVDSSNEFHAWAIPGTYAVELESTHHTFTEQVNLPSINPSTVLVQVLKVTTYGNCGQVCTVGYSAGFNAALDHVVLLYNDTTLTTTVITDKLYIQNISGTFLLYSGAASGHYGSYQELILCHNAYCNSTIGNQLEVVLYFDDTFGPMTVTLPVGGGGIFPIPPLPSAALGGWYDIFPATAPLTAIIALALIYGSAGVFGALSAKFGIIPVAVLVVAFTLSGWLPGLLPGAAVLLTSLAVVSYLGYLRHGR